MKCRRSLAACEGALLVVDAAQGVEAQTLANVYQSIEHDHEIVPVINKIDLPAADPEGSGRRSRRSSASTRRDAVLASAKSGIGIEEVLRRDRRQASRRPRATRAAPLKAMLVDSWYDPYLGVVILVRVIDGAIKQGPAGQVHGRRHHPPGRPRRLLPPQDRAAAASSAAGEIGFITAQIKEVAETRVGDTITDAKRPAAAGAARLQGSPAGGVLRPVPGRRRRLREAPRQPLQAAPQRRLASASRWKPAPRSASASAAASSACSTSRSSRSG